METNIKINYYIYKDDKLMKSIYTQVFDELPDIGAIEYIGSKSVNNSVNYTLLGDREKSKNKNFEIEETEKNINRNLKNQIRGEVGFHDSYGENVIRIYANIDDIKTMVNSGLYNDIVNKINATQSAVSHQLRILKTSKLVKYRKEGNLIYYSLDDEHIKKIFEMGCEHINEVYL